MLSPMNTSAFAFCKHAFVARARGSLSKYAFVIFTYFFATQAFAWTDGELLIWITGNRPFHALTHLGKIFDREIGAPVKVETKEQIIDKFQAASQSGKGPDILFWVNDRIGE